MSSIELQTEPPEPEPISERIGNSSTTWAIGCWDCMAEFFSNLWDHISDVYFCVVDWLAENLCCYCNGDGETETKLMRPPPNVNRNSPKGKIYKAQPDQSLQQVTVIAKSNVQKTVNSPQANPGLLAPSPQLQPQPQPPPPVPPSPPVPPLASSPSSPQSANARPTSPQLSTAKQTSPQQQSPQQQQQQQTPPTPNQPTGNQIPYSEPTEAPHVEPPRIDFVETGSIFGDRKRGGIDRNLLLLENGRFRSPGTSRVVHGPGGRTIRVSFVSGFPQLKSVDSSKSLATITSKVLARKSYESSSSSTDKGTTDMKLRKYKSTTKSYKSVSSSESKEPVQQDRIQ